MFFLFNFRYLVLFLFSNFSFGCLIAVEELLEEESNVEIPTPGKRRVLSGKISLPPKKAQVKERENEEENLENIFYNLNTYPHPSPIPERTYIGEVKKEGELPKIWVNRNELAFGSEDYVGILKFAFFLSKEKFFKKYTIATSPDLEEEKSIVFSCELPKLFLNGVLVRSQNEFSAAMGIILSNFQKSST